MIRSPAGEPVPNRRVLISGVAGFLGSHVADAMLADGWEVVGVDNLIGGYLDNVPAGVSFHRADCNDLPDMRALMKGASVVYHCAATAYEGLSVFSPHFVTRNIVTATTGMMTAAIANKVGRFVFCSSMARYGRAAVPFTEDSEPRPEDPYGIGKLAAEMLVRNLAETHGVEWVVAVPHNIIGPRQKYDDPYRNVAAMFINLLLQGRPVVIHGDGSQKRCFSFVSDVVAPLRQMATDPACAGEVINVGPDAPFISVLELATLIARLLGVELRCEFVPPRPREVPLANCSAAKARALLGYRPRVSLEEGLRAMIDWIRARGPRPFRHHVDLEIVSEALPKAWSPGTG
jgi:UDP-glucose 4-epimerase